MSWTFVIYEEEVWKRFQTDWIDSKASSYEVRSIAGDALVAVSNSKETYLPNGIFLRDRVKWIQQALQSAERYCQPRAYVSVGLLEGEPKQLNHQWWIPKTCVRSTGRMDFDHLPMLYEELGFDTSLIDEFSSRLFPGETYAYPVLFSGERSLRNDYEREWVFRQLGAHMSDALTAEILLAARAFKVKCCCIKAKNVDDLSLAWKKFFDSFHR